MVMELGSTRWTSTVPTPFGPAPGAGLGGMRRRGTDLGYTSGFAADLLTQEFTAAAERVIGKWPVTLKKIAVQAGEIPAALVRLYFTDRGVINQTVLDNGVASTIKKAGFVLSKATRFEPVSVRWRWAHDTQADFYYPVVSSPSSIVGMKYAGNAIQLPAYTASPAELSKLPTQLYVYTFAVTTPAATFADSDGAKVLSLLKSSLSNVLPTANAYANVHMTMLGSAPDVFPPGLGSGGGGSGSGSGGAAGGAAGGSGGAAGGSGANIPITQASVLPGGGGTLAVSSLLLLVAFNLLNPHIGANPY